MKNTEVKNILIRATNWIGDSIMSLPALEEIKENFPNAHICVLSKKWVADIFRLHPAVDELIIYRNFLEAVRILKKKRFDMAILFQNAFKAALLAFLSGIKIRVGLDTDGRRFLLTHPVKKIGFVHHVDQYLNILKGIGIEPKRRHPKLYLKEEDLRIADEIIKREGLEGRFIIGISPGASYGSAKRWPPDYFSKIVERATKALKAAVFIFGTEAEAEISRKILRNTEGKVLDFCGKTDLRKTIALIKRCNMFVSNDSGLMHVSASLGVPTVGIFGSTDPERTGPKGEKVKIVKKEIPCSPCFKRECPFGRPRCLYLISPEEVWKAMEELLDA